VNDPIDGPIDGRVDGPVDNPRLERFMADVAALHRNAGKPDPDAVRARIGGALLAAGILIGVGAYFLSHRTTDALIQGDALVVCGIGVSVSVAGAAMYIRHGLSHFLRFWLARLIYENAVARGTTARGTDSEPGAAARSTTDTERGT
jgi:hypothetical protein